MKKVVTRMAPAPTGFLHIGNARTALFNWLFARHHGGTYLLRIEDTDRERSTQEAIDVVFQGLGFLGLLPDEEAVFQSRRAPRHAACALELAASGKAYYCACTPEELDTMRTEAMKAGLSPKYDGRCQHKHLDKGALRLKVPHEGSLTIQDMVQGEVTVDNSQIDDFILLRSDGTPTYMLSVVVDDHDMGVTHIIRGDDHLTNAFRQTHLYRAFGWEVPEFAHVPLIHGPDGAKFSKRHGAPSVNEYKDMGYLPAALRNYLLRLGWSHGDDEFITTEEAIKWFSPENIGRSPSRFDFKKLNHMNAHYMREMENDDLVQHTLPFLEPLVGRALTDAEKNLLSRGMAGLKQRAQTLVELAQNALFYIVPPAIYEPKGLALLTPETLSWVKKFSEFLTETPEPFTEETLEEGARQFCETLGVGLGKLAQPLRVLLTGGTVSPSVFEILTVLGKEQSLKRLHHDLPHAQHPA